MTTTPLDIACTHCGADPGEQCYTPTGRNVNPHATRLNAALVEDHRPAPLNIREPRLPKKLKFRKRATGWIWCDSHCEVHTVSSDVYDEGATECAPKNWRRVYVETDNKDELF